MNFPVLGIREIDFDGPISGTFASPISGTVEARALALPIRRGEAPQPGVSHVAPRSERPAEPIAARPTRARRLRQRVELLDGPLAARQRPPLVAVEATELGGEILDNRRQLLRSF